MNPDEIAGKARNVTNLISSFDYGPQLNLNSSGTSRTLNEDLDSANQNGSFREQDLPHYSLTRQISIIQEQTRQEKYNYLMLKLGSLQEDVTRLSGVSAALENITRNLKCLVDSSEMLVHIMKHPRRDDAIFLPHQQHEAILGIVKNCQQILEYGNWNSGNGSINWNDVVPVMRRIVDAFKDIAEIIDSRLQEHQILRRDTVEVLEQLSQLTFE